MKSLKRILIHFWLPLAPILESEYNMESKLENEFSKTFMSSGGITVVCSLKYARCANERHLSLMKGEEFETLETFQIAQTLRWISLTVRKSLFFFSLRFAG